MIFHNFLKINALLATAAMLFLFGRVDVAVSQIEGMTLESREKSEQYHALANLLANGDFEIDDDMDGFPDGWEPWSWLVEDRLDLRKAIIEYLETSPDAVVRPRITTRFPFFGKRSLDLVSIDGRTGPGVYLIREFKPGIYTLSLYTKNPGDGKRRLGVFLAEGGRLYEVGQRWRNIVHSEKLSYPIKDGEVSLRDWTFSPGNLLVDRVVLWRLPFDVRYPDRIVMTGSGDRFVLDFSRVDEVPVPVGINLEIKSPSGERIRKNIEGTLESPTDQVAFELNPGEKGTYRFKLEIYDLGTADVIFSDDDIRAFYGPVDSTRAEESFGEGDGRLGFFPVGIRAHAHELSNLGGRDFNSVLITEPDADAIDLYRNHLAESDMKFFFEIANEVIVEGCGERFHRLVDLGRTIEGFAGWFISHPLPGDRLISKKWMDIRRCLREEMPGVPLVVMNYLPGGAVSLDTLSFDYVAIDPNPVSEPSRPLFSIGLWADRFSNDHYSSRLIGMPQVFGGWPVAHRAPTIGEVRAQSYLAIIHGARGIIYRDFSSLRPFFDQSDALWDIRKVPELWDKIPALNRELIALSPYFLDGRVGTEGIRMVRGGTIDYGAWQGEENLVLIAVNVYDGDIDAVFHLNEGKYGDEVEVLFEDRSLRVDENALSDHFGPFQTHVYRLTSEEE